MADGFSYPIPEARQTGRSIARENEQFYSRWNVVRYRSPIPEEDRNPTLRPCAHCRAHWYDAVADLEAAAYRARPDRAIVKVMPAAPTVLYATGPHASSTSTASSSSMAPRDILWARLTELMRWHAEGRLSTTEYAQAKVLLGL